MASNTGVAATENPPTLDKENESIIFINTKPTLPPGVADAHWAKLQADIECATSFWWVKGAVALEERKAALPTGSDIRSMIMRNAFRIQVIDYNMQKSGWLRMTAPYTHTKRFEVSKDELQVEIIKNILDGLRFLEGPEKNFVKVLPRLGESLKNKDKSVLDVEPKKILITTWRYDSYKEKFFAAMRAIHFLAVSATTGKERWWDISVELRYEQIDFVFNESIWEESKEEVKRFVDTWAGKNTKKILEVPV